MQFLLILLQSFHGYKEEMEISIVDTVGDERVNDRDEIYAFDENVKKYIPSLDEKDIGLFCIVGGELCFLGNDELDCRAAKNLGLMCVDDGENVSEFIEKNKKEGIKKVLPNISSERIEYKEDDGQIINGRTKIIR